MRGRGVMFSLHFNSTTTGGVKAFVKRERISLIKHVDLIGVVKRSNITVGGMEKRREISAPSRYMTTDGRLWRFALLNSRGEKLSLQRI